VSDLVLPTKKRSKITQSVRLLNMEIAAAAASRKANEPHHMHELLMMIKFSFAALVGRKESRRVTSL
jgi:hypothetical protein